MPCCWKFVLPYFTVAGCIKYSLEALKCRSTLVITCSPSLTHQVLWNGFVNVKGGANNIPCDLYNEHINELLEYIIGNMGSNLTESSLQRAARSVSVLQCQCLTSISRCWADPEKN